LEYGFGFNYFQTAFKTFNEVNRAIEQNNSSNEGGVYVTYRHVTNNRRFVIEPGFRIQGYASVGQVTFEPRFSGKYNITDEIRFKLAGGYYTQNLQVLLLIKML